MSRKHGQTTYYIEGEGFVGEGASSEAGRTLGAAFESEVGHFFSAAPESASALNPERAFRFTRMFPQLAPFRPAIEDLIALGAAMDDTPNFNDHQTLPAGFTYFGQFLDHDITFDQTAGLPEGVLTPEEIENGRTPSLDLDSVYGRGPGLEQKPLYEADGVRLRIGRCTGIGRPGIEPESRPLPNDLPRGHNPSNRIEATIGDPRNDENLAVAQTHLAFLKFHNVVAARLAETGLRGYELFAAARRTVTLHYQWIVLHDFLARVVEPTILAQVIRDGGRFFTPPTDKQPGMPVEFSVAAYRFGHSMIRDGYTWNRIFERAGLDLLFVFSGVNGNFAGQPSLPANWPIDWRRFYDFSDVPGIEPARLNLARSIDTALAIGLKEIPEFAQEGARRPLAVRNLIRGHVVGLPSGQAVAEAMSLPALTPAQLRAGALGQVVQKAGFDKETPLWYYILREAEVFHNGQRLGPVGSTLLAETFVALINCSRTSVLREADGNWRPTLPSLRPGHYTMVDLLLLVNDLNPLGAPAEALPPPPPPPQRNHVVQPGETLRSIAARFLGDERRWREIYELNKERIANPNLIRPGLELLIPNA